MKTEEQLAKLKRWTDAEFVSDEELCAQWAGWIGVRHRKVPGVEEVMSHAYTDLEERQRLEAGTSLLKTYLLEAHSGNAEHRDILRILTSAFSPEMLGQQSRATVHETQEEFFYRIAAQWATNTAEFFVDASDRRFWILHSSSNSRKADNILRRVIANDTHLDSAWLPMQLLERVADMGIFKGLHLDYDHREVPDVEFEAADAPVEYLKMQLWGNRARQVLRILRQPDAFPNATTLSKVKIKHFLDRTVSDADFSLDEVKWDGKITARGTSFQSHINLVNSIYRSYSEKVRGFEQRFSLRFEESTPDQPHEHATVMDGEPLSLTFSRPIANLKKFMAAIFNGTDPFRLWGVPVTTAISSKLKPKRSKGNESDRVESCFTTAAAGRNRGCAGDASAPGSGRSHGAHRPDLLPRRGRTHPSRRSFAGTSPQASPLSRSAKNPRQLRL